MTRLLKMIIQELNEDYLRGIEEHLKQMDFKRGVLMSAKLGGKSWRRVYSQRTQLAG
jgi:hypothetical protein